MLPVASSIKRPCGEMTCPRSRCGVRGGHPHVAVCGDRHSSSFIWERAGRDGTSPLVVSLGAEGTHRWSGEVLRGPPNRWSGEVLKTHRRRCLHWSGAQCTAPSRDTSLRGVSWCL